MLDSVFAMAMDNWSIDDQKHSDVLHSALITILLSHQVLLPNEGTVDPRTRVQELTCEYFKYLGLVDVTAAGISVTKHWSYLQSNSHHLGVAVSYRSQLSHMRSLLFGDPASVFHREDSGGESHVDRSENVAASGKQHRPYFDRLVKSLVKKYADIDANAPLYVGDLGCGDGSLLRRIFDETREIDRRNDHFRPIGIDLNAEALAAARRMLPPNSMLFQGDIRKPQELISELQKAGVETDHEILHVRSFLDHDRSFALPENVEEACKWRCLKFSGVYADGSGARILPELMFQALIEHLRSWSASIGEHGLLLLEVHCRVKHSPETLVDDNAAYFQALQALSGQQLIEACYFHLAAGMAGLFSRSDTLLQFPELSAEPLITLHWFDRQRVAVRLGTPVDLQSICELEQTCWNSLATPRHVIENRLNNPLETFLLHDRTTDRLVASLAVQRVSQDVNIMNARWDRLARLAADNGPILLLIALNADPDYHEVACGGLLLEFVLNFARLSSDFDAVIGVSRCKNFSGKTHAEYRKYVFAVNSQALPIDPVLRLHVLHGAKIEDIVMDYRPDDTANLGCGVVIRYPLRSEERGVVQENPKATHGEFSLSEFAEEIVEKLGDERIDPYSHDRAFRDMGLDSLDLQALSLFLSERVGRMIRPDLFFKYPTPRQLVQYVTEKDGFQMSTSKTGRESPVANTETSRSVAIVGIGLRLPGGSDTPSSFWEFLRSGRHGIVDVPDDRWGDVEWTRQAVRVRRAAFIRDLDEFDYSFFEISPREARLMDPQQRLLLQTTWHALEDAGIAPSKLAGSATGVWVGISSNDYCRRVFSRIEKIEAHSSTGTAFSTAAGRISYVLGLNGPCNSIDTACSSSLVAVHNACGSLLSGECELAIAAGVNVIFPEYSISFSRAGMLSPDFQCRSFDSEANGYVRGEGCGVVILKKLSDAVQDGDRIYSVIRSTSSNHCGRSNGLTAPSGAAQEKLVRQAVDKAGVDGGQIRFVEAHGTGTSLGDPIEANALLSALRCSGTEKLILGALKTKIGHLESAAGVASLIKASLCLVANEIPPNLNFETLNPSIDDSRDLITIPTSSIPLAPIADRRLAVVNSFGFGGTNACALLEQWSGPSPRQMTDGVKLHPFKASRAWFSSDGLRARYHELPLSGFVRKEANVFEWQIEGLLLAQISEHRIKGHPILPASSYVSLLLEIGQRLRGHILWEIRDAEILNPVFLSEPVTIRVSCSPHDTDRARIAIECSVLRNRIESSRLFCLRATLVDLSENPPSDIGAEHKIHGNESTLIPEKDLEWQRTFYTRLSDLGYEYGPVFQCLTEGRIRHQRGLGSLSCPQKDGMSRPSDRLCEMSARIDSGLHLGVELLRHVVTTAATAILLPTSWKCFRLLRDFRLATRITTSVRLSDESNDNAKSVICSRYESDNGELVAEFEDVQLSTVTTALLVSLGKPQEVRMDEMSHTSFESLSEDFLPRLRAKAAEILGLSSTEELDVDLPLSTLGMDSIMFVELKLAIDDLFGIQIATDVFVQEPSLRQIARSISDYSSVK